MDLTSKPSVPVLVRAAIAAAMATVPLGCGDDGGGDDANSTDVAPTAGPCFHDGGDTPECMGTGTSAGSVTLTTAATDTGGTMDGTATVTTTDTAPTAGPCFHADGGMLPECMTTGPEDDSTGDATDSGTGTGTGGSDSGTTGGGG